MPNSYQRIVSLVPSLTELLIDLGLGENIVGRTRFCVHPKDKIKDIPIVGGTKNPRLDKIKSMEPDLVIGNREENRKDHILELQQDFNVHVTDIATIEDALITIHELGKKLGRGDKANTLIEEINEQLEKRPDEPPLRTLYFIWKDPWMTVGNDTYIHDVMRHWNLMNIFREHRRYPQLNREKLQRLNPQLVLLSSEPYPFKEKHLPEVEELCPGARILLVEGQWFSWYGSRMRHAFQRLNVWRKAIA